MSHETSLHNYPQGQARSHIDDDDSSWPMTRPRKFRCSILNTKHFACFWLLTNVLQNLRLGEQCLRMPSKSSPWMWRYHLLFSFLFSFSYFFFVSFLYLQLWSIAPPPPVSPIHLPSLQHHFSPLSSSNNFNYNVGSIILGSYHPTNPASIPLPPNSQLTTSQVFPVISGFCWLGMLLGLLIHWNTIGRPHYPWMASSQSIAYISDVGASSLKPLFIAGSAVTTVFLDLSFLSERWLRHRGRLAANTSRTEKVLAALSIVFALIGTAGLILLSIFDTNHHHRVHDVMLLLFIVGYIVSAVFICWEYQRLGIRISPYHPNFISSLTK